MSSSDRFTESENAIVRFVAAFVQLPGSPMKLSKAELKALQAAQAKLNSQDW